LADSTFTFRVDKEFKAAFSEVAAVREHTAAQLLRVLMREAVRQWRESQEHDVWFRGEVEHALEEAKDPAVERIPHDRAVSTWRQQRAELERPDGVRIEWLPEAERNLTARTRMDR
jgi:aspartyl/asparaginyl-tRNA synthetase